MKYRPEIDGLRAIAVIPVILFHAGYSFFIGGFVGVDIFFVLSGYLITTIILTELKNESFSIVNFYERRARRILPSLFFVLTCSFLVGYFWLLPSDLQAFCQSLIAVVIFCSNLFFWQTIGYFSSAAELLPLLHTWSLAVEEQYYVFFPLVLMFVFRLGFKFIALITLATFIFSLALSHIITDLKPEAAFFLLPTRAWELLLGAIIAMYIDRYGFEEITKKRLTSQCLSFIGLILILTSIITLDQNSGFPGLIALIPTVGTGLIILFAIPGTLAFRILSHRLLVGIGLISYSAYLWHQPLMAFARHRALKEPDHFIMGIICVLTLGLAYLSWRFIETPFRNKNRFSRSSIFKLSACASVIFILIGVAGIVTNGFSSRVDNNEVVKLESLIRHNPGLSENCTDKYTESSDCTSGSNEKVLLWGDSYAMHLANALKDSSTTFAFRQHTIHSCRPILDISTNEFGKSWQKQCIKQNKRVLEWIKSSETIKYVVIGSIFSLSNKGYVLENGKLQPYKREEVLRYISNTVQQLVALDVRPIIVAPPPKPDFNVGPCVLKATWFSQDINECDFSLSENRPALQETYKLLSEVEKFAPVYWLHSLTCEGDICRSTVGEIPIYGDRGHFSIEASSYLGEQYDMMGALIDLADKFDYAETSY